MHFHPLPASGLVKSKTARYFRYKTRVSSASPSLRQFSVSPVPQQIKDDLARSACCVRKGLVEADVCTNVLPAADRDLHLRDDVPIALRTINQIAIGNKLHHW